MTNPASSLPSGVSTPTTRLFSITGARHRPGWMISTSNCFAQFRSKASNSGRDACSPWQCSVLMGKGSKVAPPLRITQLPSNRRKPASRTVSNMPSCSSTPSKPGCTDSPGRLRGKASRSMISGRKPHRAQRMAAHEPAGPPLTMMTSRIPHRYHIRRQGLIPAKDLQYANQHPCPFRNSSEPFSF